MYQLNVEFLDQKEDDVNNCITNHDKYRCMPLSLHIYISILGREVWSVLLYIIHIYIYIVFFETRVIDRRKRERELFPYCSPVCFVDFFNETLPHFPGLLCASSHRAKKKQKQKNDAVCSTELTTLNTFCAVIRPACWPPPRSVTCWAQRTWPRSCRNARPSPTRCRAPWTRPRILGVSKWSESKCIVRFFFIPFF